LILVIRDGICTERVIKPYIVLVFLSPARLFFATSFLYGMVCNHSLNYRWENFLRLASETYVYFTVIFLYTSWISPSIDRTWYCSILEVYASNFNYDRSYSFNDDRILYVCHF